MDWILGYLSAWEHASVLAAQSSGNTERISSYSAFASAFAALISLLIAGWALCVATQDSRRRAAESRLQERKRLTIIADELIEDLSALNAEIVITERRQRGICTAVGDRTAQTMKEWRQRTSGLIEEVKCLRAQGVASKSAEDIYDKADLVRAKRATALHDLSLNKMTYKIHNFGANPPNIRDSAQ